MPAARRASRVTSPPPGQWRSRSRRGVDSPDARAMLRPRAAGVQHLGPRFRRARADRQSLPVIAGMRYHARKATIASTMIVHARNRPSGRAVLDLPRVVEGVPRGPSDEVPRRPPLAPARAALLDAVLGRGCEAVDHVLANFDDVGVGR